MSSVLVTVVVVACALSISEGKCLQAQHVSEAIAAFRTLPLRNKEKFGKSSGAWSAGCSPLQTFDPIRQRGHLGSLLKTLNFTGVGVEVGTQQGDYSGEILRGWKRAGLYIQVDLWQPQQNYHDLANVNQASQNANMLTACGVLETEKKKGRVREVAQCKNYSTECSKMIPDDSLDFVYIDARHDRKGVLADLAAYWPKVRDGGLIAGHDYIEQYEIPDWHNSPDDDYTLNFDGTTDTTGRVVRGAVNDFFSGVVSQTPEDLRRCPRQVVVTYRENEWNLFANTWIVRK